jgi:hypothetical protein
MKIIDPIVSEYIDIAIERQQRISNTRFDEFETRVDAKIDAAIERERLIFDANIKHYMTVQREILQDDIRKIAEMVQDRPTRSEVQGMIDENMGNHGRRISRLEAKVF